MDFTTFKANIITDLGGELVDVELTDSSVTAAFSKAKRIHQQKGNDNHKRAFEPLAIVKGQRIYNIDPQINDCIRFIRPSHTSIVNGDPFSMALYDQFFSPSATGTDLSIYELSLQKLEILRDYTAYDTQFLFDRRADTIELLQVPTKDEQWLIECYKSLSDDEYRDVNWIYEYSLAESKLQLGYAYRKFQTVGGPTGEASLSGDQMVSEALERKRELEEEIKEHTDGEAIGMPIVFG